MKERMEDWSTKAASMFAVLFVIYFLTAPPVMTSIARQRGSVSFPAVYQPIFRVIESDFNGPVLWYFNDVWHSGIIVIGEASTTPKVTAAYGLAGFALVSAVAFPFLRRRLRRTQQ